MAGRFRLGHAAGGDWHAVAALCAEQLGPRPGNLGFFYASDHFAADCADIADELRRLTGIAHWTGCTGIGICATGIEYFDQPALVALAGEFEPGSFRIFGAESGRPAAAELRCADGPASIAVVHGDAQQSDIARQIRQLAALTETGFLVGGLASSRRPAMAYADAPAAGALSGVAFSDVVTVATRLTQGCAPLGAPRQITGAQHNIVLELDDRPALDVLREEAGIGDDAALSRMGGRLFVGLSAGGGDPADYVVRNLIGIDPGNRLIAVGDLVGKGQQLRFFRRDRESARADMGRMLDSIREGLYTKPRGALYFSCLGRGGALFGGESEELKMIEAALGDVPLAGFFGNGEISRNLLYGYTGVLTLFV